MECSAHGSSPYIRTEFTLETRRSDLAKLANRHDDRGFEVKERFLPADAASWFPSDVANVFQQQGELHRKNVLSLEVCVIELHRAQDLRGPAP